MDNPSPDVTVEGFDPPPFPEAFQLASLAEVNLPQLSADGLNAAIDEVVFGEDQLFFDEGSSLLTDPQPVAPSVVISAQRTSPIAYFAALRPLSVDGLPPPSSGFPSPASPNGLPHPSPTGPVQPRPPPTDSHPAGSPPSVPHVRCRLIQSTVAIALRNICPNPLYHPLQWMSLTLVLPPFLYLGSNTCSQFLGYPQLVYNV